MWQVDYYTRPTGRKPAKDWIEDKDNNSIRPNIDAKIQTLIREGPLLRDNRMLRPIEERRRRQRGRSRVIHGFFELTGKNWRIAVYHDLKKDMFLLFWGWRKTRQSEEREVERAIRLLEEYKSRQEE